MGWVLAQGLRWFHCKMTHTHTIVTQTPRSKRVNTTTKLFWSGLLVLAVCLFNTTANASTIELDSRFHLRFGVAVVAGSGNIDTRESTISFAGPGVLDGVQIGFKPTKNLSVFFEGDSLILFAQEKNTMNHTNDVTVYNFLTGAGVGYTFDSTGIYVSGAAGLSLNNIEFNDQKEGVDINRSNFGFGLSIMAGHEWSVSEKWAVGLGSQLLYTASQGQSNTDNSTHTLAAGLLMTAKFK